MINVIQELLSRVSDSFPRIVTSVVNKIRSSHSSIYLDLESKKVDTLK